MAQAYCTVRRTGIRGPNGPVQASSPTAVWSEMLTQASTSLPYPSTEVVAALAAPDLPWGVALDGDGGQLLAKVGITIGRIPVYKHVRLVVGVSDAALRTDRVMLPVSWVAAGGPPLFPKMEGTLHAEPDGPNATKLTLNATYDPPLGALGKVLDMTLMHRVAEITMGDFVQRLARTLSAELARRATV